MVASLEHWVGKVAVVSRACSGCGPAIIERLVTAGVHVVGLTNREGTLDNLAKKLEGSKGKLFVKKADNTKRKEISSAFDWIKESLGPVHILINNGGINPKEKFLGNGVVDRWLRANDTNVFALAFATKETVKDMRRNNTPGQIIHIGSVMEHFVGYLPKFNLYGATLFASKALVQTFWQDLLIRGTKIRICSIKIGNTEYAKSEKVSKKPNAKPTLQAEDVADVVAYILSTSPRVLIRYIKVIPFDNA